MQITVKKPRKTHVKAVLATDNKGFYFRSYDKEGGAVYVSGSDNQAMLVSTTWNELITSDREKLYEGDELTIKF